MRYIFPLSLVALAIALFIGWVLNIIALFGALAGPVTAMFIARCVGVFVGPLGAIFGYL